MHSLPTSPFTEDNDALDAFQKWIFEIPAPSAFLATALVEPNKVSFSQGRRVNLPPSPQLSWQLHSSLEAPEATENPSPALLSKLSVDCVEVFLTPPTETASELSGGEPIAQDGEHETQGTEDKTSGQQEDAVDWPPTSVCPHLGLAKVDPSHTPALSPGLLSFSCYVCHSP